MDMHQKVYTEHTPKSFVFYVSMTCTEKSATLVGSVVLLYPGLSPSEINPGIPGFFLRSGIFFCVRVFRDFL